jgi:hypothetical protein
MVWTLAGAARMVVPDPANPGDGVSKGGVRVEEETGVSPLCERKERETGQPCRIIGSARHARWTANPETTFAVSSRLAAHGALPAFEGKAQASVAINAGGAPPCAITAIKVVLIRLGTPTLY